MFKQLFLRFVLDGNVSAFPDHQETRHDETTNMPKETVKDKSHGLRQLRLLLGRGRGLRFQLLPFHWHPFYVPLAESSSSMRLVEVELVKND